jgi:hypothetical protein
MNQSISLLLIFMVSLTFVCQAISLGLPPHFGIINALRFNEDNLYSNRKNYETMRKIQETKRKKQELLRNQEEEQARKIINQVLSKYGSNVLMDFYSGRY